MSDFQVSLAIEIHLQVVFLLFQSSFSIQSDFIIIGKYLETWKSVVFDFYLVEVSIRFKAHYKKW